MASKEGVIWEVMEVPPLGCNCTIVGDLASKEALVVDPGGNVKDIIKVLTKHGLICKRILVTHGHLDHILGATELKEQTGADILMHQDDLGLYERVNEQCRDFGVPIPKAPLARPDAFLADGDVVQWAPDLSLRCLHCPGHTPGSMSYYFEKQKLCCPGDTLFSGNIGRTRWDGIPSLRGTSDSRQIVASIYDKLLPLDEDITIISGHGEETSIGEARQFMRHFR
mmetsp:Transcript_78852/g.163929  ORF Transcript_78852/g.163929 Transcript_78852/m.163929 type:complete len:225 (-) Transcript_78852:17-691(-)|eukprot:CAMPEP_0206454494 /NCGR_PEP_ID=MMETSP0324_2-20121206/21169_1 /ASSEMBLY_ACC=CAM_ASM_000836 /TAXON_ID=2866 /ORGANISM="Crypthecodinium cohnii, Strain Seligo" /LENGTH=224 /DNA_ID=CAMNT_0053924975 /DNA_START=33 /DNA_END=707 /DNA_ORIENTATION=+